MGDEPTGNNNGDVLSPEQVAQLQADLEAEKAKSAAAVEEATKPLTDRIATLEQDLQTKDVDLQAKNEELTAVKTQLSEKDTGFVSLTEERDGAITAYKELVQKTNPVIPADMITGTNIAEINASLEKANTLVTQIRTKLEENNNNNSVPAGAPGRTEPDISGMSTREKISYGLQKSKKQS
jgi:DNA repair exonuclease SbcCD ATPase subunit